ncbi:MAG: hypothetical protein GXO83_10720 [Chlorobi bacterium]|nr:hypothetical protein [Chlorobiota bacterium]
MKSFIIFLLLLVSTNIFSQQGTSFKPVTPYSPVVQAGNTFYLSGQIPRVPETGKLVRGDIQKATEQVMKNIGVILRKYGMDYHHIVKCTVYLKNMDDYAVMNKAYVTFFKDRFPARVAVQVARIPLDADIEISCIAVKKEIKIKME